MFDFVDYGLYGGGVLFGFFLYIGGVVILFEVGVVVGGEVVVVIGCEVVVVVGCEIWLLVVLFLDCISFWFSFVSFVFCLCCI